MELLDKILLALGQVDGAMIMTISVILEVVLRLVKSERPMSVLLMIAKALEIVGKITSKIAELLNKVIPQRLK